MTPTVLPGDPPSVIAELMRGRPMTPSSDHWSDALVARVDADPPLYLKVAPGDSPYPVRDEHDRLRWLWALPADTWGDTGRPPAPRVLAYADAAGHEWLLTEALPGTPAITPCTGRTADEVADAAAAAVRAVHALPVDACPFRFGVDELLAHARDRVVAGEVAPAWLATVGWEGTPEEAFAHLEGTIPEPDGVVVHGDAALGNLLLDGDRWAWVDWGWAGVGHRAHDLATCATTLRLHHGPAAAERFLAAATAGPPVDPDAIAFFTLLDGLT